MKQSYLLQLSSHPHSRKNLHIWFCPVVWKALYMYMWTQTGGMCTHVCCVLCEQQDRDHPSAQPQPSQVSTVDATANQLE